MSNISNADAMDIEVKLLRSFIAIYELGSLSRAADKLACTQAAMSMRLKMLETEMGERLFVRHHHRIDATSKGSELYARALGVLAAYDEMISATRSLTKRQKFRIGVPDDYASGILAPVIRRMQAEFTDYDFEILCDLSANLAARLQKHDLDFAIVTLAARPNSARFSFETRLLWVMPSNTDILTDGPVALAAYPEGCVFRRSMISALEHARREWRVAVQCCNQAGILAAVNGGVAITSMAEATVPSTLVGVGKTLGLPILDSVPIYVMSNAGPKDRALLRLEELVAEELTNTCSANAQASSGINRRSQVHPLSGYR